MDAEKPVEPDKLKEQSLPVKNVRPVSRNASKDAGIGHSIKSTTQSGFFGSRADHPVHPSDVYAPQAQAIYYKGQFSIVLFFFFFPGSSLYPNVLSPGITQHFQL
ncbi:hypothetical protein U1Q18_006206 [Sarracenia purpurea var. burkii]